MSKIELYKGNCLEVMKQIPDKSVDFIISDVPYKIGARGSCDGTGGMFATKLSMEGKIFDNNEI